MKIPLSVLFVLLFAFSFSVMAQTSAQIAPSIKKDTVHQHNKGEVLISGGIGFSSGFVGFASPIQYDMDDQSISCSPEYNGAVEYRFNQAFGLDAAVGYQTGVLYADYPNYPRDNITKLNLAIRTLFYLNKENKYFDHYIGLRFGLSNWHDKTYDSSNPFPLIMSSSSANLFSFQVLYGLTLYPGGSIVGFNFEVGIGTPYLGQAGLIFRIR